MSDEEQVPPLSAWSFSRLEVFDKCPYRAFLQYVRKVPEPENTARNDALERGKRVHEMAERFVRGDFGDKVPVDLHRFKDNFQRMRELYAEGRVLLEEEWAFDREWNRVDWFAPNVWLRAKLDRFVWLDDKKTEALLCDYKTGKKFGNEVKHNMQGQLYAACAFVVYPQLKRVHVQNEYLDHGEVSLRKVYDAVDAAQIRERFTERALRMTTATEFPPKPSKITCRWCPYGPINGNDTCEYGVNL